MVLVAAKNIFRTPDRWHLSSVRTLLVMVSVALVLVTTVFFSSFKSSSVSALTRSDLQLLLDDVRGDDSRLVRWDATEHTSKRQEQGACSELPAALDLIGDGQETDDVRGLAAEYATFCITDNPVNRAKLASHGKDIHQRIADLVASEKACAIASHLIYIASFANGENQIGFFEAGAVTKLASVIQDSASQGQERSNKITPVQVMWAAAALQNMAASYCDTVDDGRCYWFWPRSRNHLVLTKRSGPVLSSGRSIRRDIAQNHADVVEALRDYTCKGPVEGSMDDEINPFPGENAVTGKHETSPNVIAWAAAGALKNLALEEEAIPLVEPALPCFCRLAHSDDWLEENKGRGALVYLRRGDPCWFKDDPDSDKLCVDGNFFDSEGYTCADYDDATEEECETIDREEVSAREACCACGGGVALSREEL